MIIFSENRREILYLVMMKAENTQLLLQYLGFSVWIYERAR